MDIDLKHAVSVGEHALRSIRSYVCIRHGDVVQEPKGAKEIVTEADREVERQLLAQLQVAFPTWGYHAEEGGGTDEPGSNGLMWAVDPIDGTTNFSSGVPLFASMLVLMQGTDLLVSLIYDPLRDLMFRAVKGEGATLNGDPITISTRNDLDRSQLLYEVGYLPGEREYFYSVFESVGQQVRSFRRLGCSGISGASVARGGYDAMLAFGTHPLHDCAPVALLVREAGGLVLDFQGNEWTLGTSSSEILCVVPQFAEPLLNYISQAMLLPVAHRY